MRVMVVPAVGRSAGKKMLTASLEASVASADVVPASVQNPIRSPPFTLRSILPSLLTGSGRDRARVEPTTLYSSGAPVGRKTTSASFPTGLPDACHDRTLHRPGGTVYDTSPTEVLV